jgi:hypothetical protein
VMAWDSGQTAVKRGLGGFGSRSDRPAFANVGYSNVKRRRKT